MRAQEFIIEAVGGNYLYHGVPDGKTVAAILKSGFIKPQPVFDFDRNPDDDSEEANPPVISLTRDQRLRFPYGRGVAQFVIDKDALTKSGIIVKPKVGAMYGRSESEERSWTSIPVKAPFVVAVQYDSKLKVPPAIIKHFQELGVKIEPWKSVVAKSADNAPKEIPPAQDYTDPTALKLKSQDFFGDTVWTIYYNTGGGGKIIQPYYLIKDEVVAKKAYAAIKDRIAKGLSFDDVLPQSQYGKSWSKGEYEIKPGDRGYKGDTP